MFGLMPYDPFRDMENLEKRFFGSSEPMRFKTDIRDAGEAYELDAELPGFDKSDISVDIDGDLLTISARHSSESEEKDKKGNYLRRERSWGAFSRSFDVSAIRAEDIAAKYENGVLKLTLPKKDAVLPSARKLEIE